MLHLNALEVEGIYNTVLHVCLDCDQSLSSHNVHVHLRFCERQKALFAPLIS